MESFPFFFKVRALAFTCIMLFSFLWLVLSCVDAYARWDVSDQISHSLVILFVLTSAITLIMLPMLLLVEFRAWLDAARLHFLFVLQIGSAAAGTYWSPKIQCPGQTPDDIGVCQLIGVYTMIACWIIPVILVIYLVYFAIIFYLQSRIPVVVEPKQPKHQSGDPEIGSYGSLASLVQNTKEVVGTPTSTIDGNSPFRSLVLPSVVQARHLSLPHSSHRQPTLPMPPHRQSTMPSSSHVAPQPVLSLAAIPSRHRSLPAFKHGNGPHSRPALTFSVSPPISPSAFASYTQTPSPRSHHQNYPISFGPTAMHAQQSVGYSRHLSQMPSPSSPSEIQTEGGPMTRSSRARLSKPLPAHLL